MIIKVTPKMKKITRTDLTLIQNGLKAGPMPAGTHLGWQHVFAIGKYKHLKLYELAASVPQTRFASQKEAYNPDQYGKIPNWIFLHQWA